MGIFNKFFDFINGTEPQKHQEGTPKAADSDQESVYVKGADDTPAAPAADRSRLYSDDDEVQRNAWYIYLMELLSSIQPDKNSSVKNFAIYIRKGKVEYAWNDETFNTNLKRALQRKNLGHIGESKLYIEVVSDKRFNKNLAKTVRENQFKQQFDDVLFFGSKNETIEDKFTFSTQIEKRHFVVEEFEKKFNIYIGINHQELHDLTIFVSREEDDDVSNIAWADETFVKRLKLQLANAGLAHIGSHSLKVVSKPLAKITESGYKCLIENEVYYKFIEVPVIPPPPPTDKRVIAKLSIIEGTGSMVKSSYILDSDTQMRYNIGRGPTSNRGVYRINDIVIKDREADPDLQDRNNHVSSCHADIVFNNGNAFLQAAAGGCRPKGGSPTKLIKNGQSQELTDTAIQYLLQDGDMIELGRNVLLTFNILDSIPTEGTPAAKTSAATGNAMSIDDSF